MGIARDGKTLLHAAGMIYSVPAAGVNRGRSPSRSWKLLSRLDALILPLLAYCAKRGDNFDLYDIATEGGDERRLTMHAGYDDGPDYSPDGRWIYFNPGSLPLTASGWSSSRSRRGPRDTRPTRMSS